MSQLETLQRMLSHLGGILMGGTDGTKDIGNGSHGHINILILYIYIYYAILISIVHGVELKVFAQPSSCRSSWFSCWDGERPRKADILLQTLDARDPQYCRCAELEAWATQKLRCKRTGL